MDKGLLRGNAPVDRGRGACLSWRVGCAPDELSPSERMEALERELAREKKISTALREVGAALGRRLDLDDLLELILGAVTDLLEADRSTLYLLDAANGELVSRIVLGGQVRSIRVRVGHGIAGAVAESGQAIRLKDAYLDARFEPEWDMFTGYRTRSMLAAPLKNHIGRTIGVIQVLNKQVGEEFGDEDEAILSVLSTQAAIAIDNTRLMLSLTQRNQQLYSTKNKLERRVADLQLLNELESAMARAPSQEDLAHAVLSALIAACQAQAGTLLLAEEESGDLLQYLLLPGPAELTLLRVKAGEGLAAAAARTGKVLDLEAIGTHPNCHPRVEGALPFEVGGCLILPLAIASEPLGALGIFSSQGSRAFEEEDRSLLELVAANVTTAVRLFRVSEQRERSQRLTTIGRLLSQVVHDFKTPMTVINGHVQMMTSEREQAERERHAASVLRQFRVLTTMQRELLEFARGEAKIFVRKVILSRFFNELGEHVGLEIGARPVALVFDVDTKITARFDETRIARAVQNLARNAIEAMSPAGGRLTLGARMDDEDLLVTVSDTGPGIPQEVRGRLFQSFVTSGKEGGTGLGLAIVKKVVEEHKGTIDVRSSPAGAMFELRLPQRAEVQSLLPPAPEGDKGSRGPGEPNPWAGP